MKQASDHMGSVLGASRQENVERECQEHGRYSAVKMLINNREIETLCPTCREAEDNRKRQQEWAERKRHRAEAEERAAAGRAGIPPRFRGKALSGYQVTHPDTAQPKALALCVRYVERMDQVLLRGSNIVLCGDPGTGKTHLACGIAYAFSLANHSVVYTSVQALVRRVKETWRGSGESETQAIDAYVAPKLLVLDEIGVQFGSEAERNILYEVLNGRYEHLRPSILLSNLGRAEIAEYLGSRLMDRLTESGVVIACKWGSYRGREGGGSGTVEARQ